MSDSRSDEPEVAEEQSSEPAAETGTDPDAASPEDRELTTEELRAQVEAKYDFENFGPREMEQMTVEEWEAVFDPETWITGEKLLDRVEADLKNRVLQRDVFARVERLSNPERVVAYSDEGYAVVYPDGSIEGEGTVLRDVKPTVALCSMDDYDVPPMPEGDLLPKPMDVPEGSGEFGNLMIQIIAGAQVLAGLVLLGAAVFTDLSVISGVAGLGFLFIGLLLFFTVANARLSDKFRAEEYRNRLRAVGLEDGERPSFLPDSARESPELSGGDEDGESTA
ncbi:DUF7319 domain-containing protein [Halorarius litoreus]|uniref:DUF7319 domain-containing protein n=1 Tax=Halorarius litoreus TaxID=2962676 RepID=UPI0020CC531F|nr:hypothetical protein [Halorarius litoreus]